VQGPKKNLKMCYACDFMYVDPNLFPAHRILFSTDYFFAKPNMHAEIGKQIVLMPNRCINHIGKLNSEELADLEKLVRKVQRFYKYKTGHLPLIWAHNDPTKGFHNSTPHLHFHFMPFSFNISEKNIQEMKLIKTNMFNDAALYDIQKPLLYVRDSKRNQYISEELSAPFFLFDELAKKENSRLLKYTPPEIGSKYIAETIDFFKDFNLNYP
jgi:diadenosine tetraphosphate (Ap4A) HIT family hydrolase